MSVRSFIQLGDPVVITDENDITRFMNAGYVKLTGYSEEELVGKPANVICSGLTEHRIYRAMRKGLKRHGSWRGIFTNHHKDGTLFHSHCSIIKFREDKDTFYIGICRRLENIAHGTYMSEEQITDWQIRILETIAYMGESDDPNVEQHVSNVRRYTTALVTLLVYKFNNKLTKQASLTLPLASTLQNYQL